MSHLPDYVVSDIHLGGVPEETRHKFRTFLQHLPGRTSRLLINGDLFDFWFEYRSVIPARHYRTLAALADLREAGVQIDFIGGNHDAWGGRFLEEEVGIRILTEPAETELGGRRTLIVHGDGVGEGDLKYRAMKRVIRHPLASWWFRQIHPDWGDRLARFVSTTDEKIGTPEQADAVRAAVVARWAESILSERPELDLVLAGHTHTPAVHEPFPGRYYVNTGDWINHFTYLVLAAGAPPDLRRWE